MATNKDFVEIAAGIRIIDGIPDNIDEYLDRFYTNIVIAIMYADDLNKDEIEDLMKKENDES